MKELYNNLDACFKVANIVLPGPTETAAIKEIN
jgi:hypothetical protein